MGIQINGQNDSVTASDGSLSIGGNVSIPGVLTYEDVTSVDSVGIVTAQAGIHVTGGDVSIGHNNPSHKLDVVGNTQLYGTVVVGASNDISPSSSGTGQLLIDANGYAPYIAADGTAMYIGHNSAARDLILQTDETDRLVIDGATGNVGIGTDVPQGELHVKRTSSTGRIIVEGAALAQIGLRDNAGGTDSKVIQIRNNAQNLLFGTQNDSYQSFSEKVRITSGGNIGIGTDNPDRNVHVNQSGGDAVITIESSGNGNDSALEFRRTSSSGDSKGAGSIYVTGDTSASEARMHFGVGHNIGHGSSPRMTIMVNGEIGIGNTSPLYAMHFKNEMSTTPSYIHMEVTGTNTVGGGGGIAFDTSASNNASNNSLYLATIRGERTSDDDGSNNLVFSTSRAGSAGDDGNNHTPAERLRIGTRGELGLSGANYGTAGQVIKSNGSGASPAWSDLYSRYFYGEQDAQQGSWPNATYKKLQNLGGRAINIGPSSIATWDESGGNLTIGADGAGYWFLSMSGGIDDIQNADFVQVVIGKNGGTTSVGTRVSSYSRAYSSTTNQITDAQVSCIANLSAGDVVRFYLYHQEGTADEHSEPSRCFAMGYKI